MAVLQFCSIQSATSKSLFMTAVLYSLTDSSSRKLTNHHVDLFVAEVVAVVLRDVAHGPVQVRHRHDLPAHVVVEPDDAVGIDQAVAHPHPDITVSLTPTIILKASSTYTVFTCFVLVIPSLMMQHSSLPIEHLKPQIETK